MTVTAMPANDARIRGAGGGGGAWREEEQDGRSGGVVSIVSGGDVSDEEEEEASMRAEVAGMEPHYPQHHQQQHQGGEGMCAAGRWLLGTLFAALGGFVGKNFLFPATVSAASDAAATWGVPYMLGCLVLDAALGLVAGLAVLGAAAMGEGRPYRPNVNAPPTAAYVPVPPHQRQQRQWRHPTSSSPPSSPPLATIVQQHLLVLLAGAAGSVMGGWAVARASSRLARWGLVKGLWWWHALRQGRRPVKSPADDTNTAVPSDPSSSAPVAVHVTAGWLLLQGALASAAAVGVQEYLLKQQQQQGQQGERPPLFCFLRWRRGRQRGGERGEEGKGEYEAVQQGDEDQEEEQDEWAWGEEEEEEEGEAKANAGVDMELVGWREGRDEMEAV